MENTKTYTVRVESQIAGESQDTVMHCFDIREDALNDSKQLVRQNESNLNSQEMRLVGAEVNIFVLEKSKYGTDVIAEAKIKRPINSPKTMVFLYGMLKSIK